eukprot:TRINITY_DN36432_c0_g1_i1.p1 TRINITY_DN36432_c0_g1~~TRINITY_DN36432_c0_g1_i1.p1  ORF type:complete len:108 (-),score=2.63 TRINITY_DN36432_c0_g1_i1:125-448(-)
MECCRIATSGKKPTCPRHRCQSRNAPRSSDFIWRLPSLVVDLITLQGDDGFRSQRIEGLRESPLSRNRISSFFRLIFLLSPVSSFFSLMPLVIPKWMIESSGRTQFS